MMRRLLLLSFLAAAATSAFAQSPVTALTVVSDPKDILEHGNTYNIGPDAPFEVAAFTQSNEYDIGFIQRVHIGVKTPPENWDLEFSANNGVLKPGFYKRVQRLNDGTGKPSVNIEHTPFGCDQNGSFAVLDAHADYSVYPPKVTRFAATFDVRCAIDPYGMTGSVYWNYVPTSTLAITNSDLHYGDTATATVTLANPAPAGGASVEFLTSEPDLVSLTSERMTIPAGERTATFPLSIIGTPVQDTRVRFLAIFNGVASEADVTVHASSRNVTRIELVSDPGDFVGGGRSMTYTATDGIWFWAVSSSNTENPPSATNYVRLDYQSPTAFWNFRFTQLNSFFPGFFAQPVPLADSGFSVGGNDRNPTVGRACDNVSGFFRVTAADVDFFNNPPKLLRFAAEFEQHCEGNAPALHGRIYYNYEPPSRFRGAKK